MIVTPKENRSFLSINCDEYRKMEADLLSSYGAATDDSNLQIPVASTLDEITEIQAATKRMEAAKQKAYDSFRDQFLKINDFVQSSKESNGKNILHAYCKKSISNKGEDQQEIIFYSRPRSTNLIVRFFDWALYGDQEDFAQKFLLRFLACAPTMKSSDALENREAKNNNKKLSGNASTWISRMKGSGKRALAEKDLSIVKTSAMHFLEAALVLKNEIEKEIEENEKEIKKNKTMISCITFEDEFFQWKPIDKNTEIDGSQKKIYELPEELKKFGVEKINDFEEFIKDVKKLNLGPTSAERTAKFSEFCATWVSFFHKKDKQGDDFRNAINRSSNFAHGTSQHII